MRLAIGAVLVLFVPLGLLGQPAPLFDHISTADGLPGDEVYSVFEDRLGFIWAGTGNGLARMEGTRVRLFHHDRNDSTSLAHDQVNWLTEDDQGRLWMATMAGLSRYDPVRGNFTSYRVAATGNAVHLANRMLQVLCVGDTLIWVVSEHGLYRFDPRSCAFHEMNEERSGEAPPGKVRVHGALLWDAHRNGMWAASMKGLSFWDVTTDHWTDHRNAGEQQPWFDDRFISSPTLQGRDTLWCFDERGFALLGWHLPTGSHTVLDSLLGSRNDFTMQWQDVDPDGRHWVSVWTHRLFYRDPGSPWREAVPSFIVPAALRSGQVTATMRSRAGERWFATKAGLAVLRAASRTMQVVALPDNEHFVNDLLPVGRDTLLIGTLGSGVFVLDQRSGTSSQVLISGVIDQDDDVTVANSINGISPLGNGRFGVATYFLPAQLRLFPLSLIADETIERAIPRRSKGTPFTFIVPGEEDDVWVGTWNRGLYHGYPATGHWARVDTLNGPNGKLPGPMMLAWLRDSKGRCWLGMNDGGGLACLENGQFRSIRDRSGGNLGGVVRCIAEAPDGTIWMGTHEEGIVVYDPVNDSSHFLNRRNGLPGVRISNLFFDRDSTLWAITDQGIARRLNGAHGFQRFALPDGLDPLSLTGGAAVLPNGRIAFGIGKYIVYHTPSKEKDLVEVPSALITSYRINDDVYFSLPSADKLQLAADRKALTLELGAVGTDPSTRPLFRYRLAKSNAAWAMLGASQRIDLFDLPTGDHRIEVQASVNGVDWSAAPAVIDVVVLPPFWATWWFRALVIAAIAVVLFVAFRVYLLGRLRKQREAFQQEQAVLQERVRIASDMHDDLGAGLSALKLRSEMALRVEKDPLKREQLGSLANTAGDLIGSMRQIIWTMNADQTSVEDLVVYASNYARTYCDQNTLAIIVEAQGPWPDARLSSEQRRNMFLVVKEALHNTVKHAQATTVRLEMRWSDGLQVELSDNGIGLPKGSENAVGNGLRNMRKRITSLGGTLSMNGEQGASIRFHVPIGPHP
ncbi:MAG: hypothetical protein IPG10_09275 [Flavobacteriales bacterium]|nr:hypothetical protein [Flavobacteriales bacterium]